MVVWHAENFEVKKASVVALEAVSLSPCHVFCLLLLSLSKSLQKLGVLFPN
jgi:hypothetical protein